MSVPLLGSTATPLLDSALHGWSGLGVLLALCGGGLLAGVRAGGGTARAYGRAALLALPASALAAIAAASSHPVSVALGAGENLATGLALLVAVGVGVLCGLALTRAAPPRGPVLRGATVRAGAELTRAAAADGEQSTLSVAGVPVPFGDETKHFKLMGTTGSGKSTALRELLHGALARGDRAVIADPDGGYLARFYEPARGDQILNPFDARSACWDPYGELSSAYDADELARALIPDTGGDPQWPGYARTLFAALLRQTRGTPVAGVGELYRLVTSAPVEELRLCLAATPAAPFLEAGNEKFFGSVRATAADAVRGLDYVKDVDGANLSVRDWVRHGSGVLFLPYQAEQITALRGLISTWLRLAIFQALSLGEGDCRLWFAIDELDALGAIDGLPDALARLRKVGGRCVLGLQSIGPITALYGAGRAQAIIENSSNTLILRCSAADGGGTARFASRLIGEREVLRTSRSVSRRLGGLGPAPARQENLSEAPAIELAVLAAEIEALADREGYLKFASSAPWWHVRFPVFDLPRRVPASVNRV